MNIDELHRRANSGSVVAQTTLGICYLDGIDVQVDYEKAFRFLSAAADQGSPRATAKLARMYSEGLRVSKSVAEAIRLYKIAAHKGEFLAQIALGRIYSQGIEIQPDHGAALEWCSAAVEQEGRVCDSEELREAKRYLRNS